ncbi:MAG: hypothetical protein ABSH00_08585 [Bryobacteraceae bacterium]|jgi:hypothetical protein
MLTRILIALLPCGLLAQTSPPQPADRGAFQKLPQHLDWLQPSAQTPQSQWMLRPFGSSGAVLPGGGVALAALPRVCSIPLLRAPLPKGVIDRMPVPVPPADSIDHMPVLRPAICADRKP